MRLAALLLLTFVQDKHKEPVKGPPWTTDYKAARREALRTAKPIFSYTTKTV